MKTRTLALSFFALLLAPSFAMAGPGDSTGIDAGAPLDDCGTGTATCAVGSGILLTPNSTYYLVAGTTPRAGSTCATSGTCNMGVEMKRGALSGEGTTVSSLWTLWSNGTIVRNAGDSFVANSAISIQRMVNTTPQGAFYAVIKFQMPWSVTSQHYIHANSDTNQTRGGLTCETWSYPGGAGNPYALNGYMGAMNHSSCPSGGPYVGFVFNDATPIGAPTGVTVALQRKADNTGACLALNWTANSDGLATGYSIFQKQGSSGSAVSPMNSSTYSYVTHVDGLASTRCGLSSGADYHYRIVPTSAVFGEGSASSDANNTTVAGWPTFVSAVQVNNTVLRVNWSLVGAGNRAQTGFSVYSHASPDGTPSYPINSSGGYNYRTHVDAPDSQANVTGLSPGTTYCFRVEGTNASASGEGDISSTTTACATTAGQPNAPVLSYEFDDTCQLALLSWTTPLGSVNGYNLTRGYAGATIEYYDASTNSAILRLLTHDSTFTIHAWNANGDGQESNELTLRACVRTIFGDNTLAGNVTANSQAVFVGVNAPNVFLWFIGFVFLCFVVTGLSLLVSPVAGGVGGIGTAFILVAVGWWPLWSAIFIGVVGFALLSLMGRTPNEA